MYRSFVKLGLRSAGLHYNPAPVRSMFTLYKPITLIPKFPARLFSVQTIKLPSMGESISEGSVQSWLKSNLYTEPGDYVEVDEVVVVIESDKLSQEIRSPVAGVLVDAFATEGQEVAVGADLFNIDSSKQKASKPKETFQEEPKKEIKPESAAKQPEKPSTPKPAQKPVEKPSVQIISQTSAKREEKREKLSKMRKRIAERLKGAQNTYAMLTTFQEVFFT